LAGVEAGDVVTFDEQPAINKTQIKMVAINNDNLEEKRLDPILTLLSDIPKFRRYYQNQLTEKASKSLPPFIFSFF
jgi:hypothetical protein